MTRDELDNFIDELDEDICALLDEVYVITSTRELDDAKAVEEYRQAQAAISHALTLREATQIYYRRNFH